MTPTIELEDAQHTHITLRQHHRPDSVHCLCDLGTAVANVHLLRCLYDFASSALMHNL
jgi:hypothetical protein